VTITAFGRVELDITKVPTSTLTSRQPADRFEDQLADVQTSHPIEARHESGRVDARNPGTPEATEPPPETEDPVPADTPQPDSSGEAGQDAAPVQNPAAPQDTTSQDDMHPAYPEEGSVRRASAGKDPGPSSSFLPQGEIRLQGNQVSQASGNAQVQVAVAANTDAGQQPQAQLQSQGQEARAVAEAFKSASRTAQAPSARPSGYRTVNPATLAAAEAARDSVIKQITFQLGSDGGKMSVQLDPPELGRLDIHMVVEKGAVLQLNIAAERPEVLMMLNKHVPELRQALTQQGLDLSGADVQTSLFEHREGGGRSGAHPGDGADMDHSELEAHPALRRMGAGYVTAEGLDFWV
jgi:flagellar hook-length control protein FliK